MAIASSDHRDIVRAITAHFGTPAPVKFFKEGQYDGRDTASEWMELRIIGPNIRESAGSKYRATVGVDILVQTQIAKDNDMYNTEDVTGAIAALFGCIVVLQADDSTVIGQLNLVEDSNGDLVRLISYGVDEDHQVKYSSVAASYQMFY